MFSDGSTLELRPRLANRPSLAAKLDSAPIVTADLGSAPTTTADLVSAPIVTVEMGKDDLAVTPLPGYPPRR